MEKQLVVLRSMKLQDEARAALLAWLLPEANVAFVGGSDGGKSWE